MAKIIMICGKIAAGKTEYAKSLIKSNSAVLLSVDEIVFNLIAPNCGEEHERAVEKTEAYLFQKSLELQDAGVNVILDWGF